MTAPSDYRPGVCNIGRSARRERRLVALLSFVGAAGYATFVLVTDAPTVLLLGLFVPLAVGIEWGLQARRSFCVTLALRGRYDLRGTAPGDGRGTVDDRRDREADRESALRLTLVGLVGGGLATGLVYAVAVLAGL